MGGCGRGSLLKQEAESKRRNQGQEYTLPGHTPSEPFFRTALSLNSTWTSKLSLLISTVPLTTFQILKTWMTILDLSCNNNNKKSPPPFTDYVTRRMSSWSDCGGQEQNITGYHFAEDISEDKDSTQTRSTSHSPHETGICSCSQGHLGKERERNADSFREETFLTWNTNFKLTEDLVNCDWIPLKGTNIKQKWLK